MREMLVRVETAGRIASLRGVFLLRETTYSTCKNHCFLISLPRNASSV